MAAYCRVSTDRKPAGILGKPKRFFEVLQKNKATNW